MKKMTFEKLWASTTNKNFNEVYMFNGRKFKITCNHQNGTPLGFNSKCCVSIMTSDGTWVGIADNRDLGFDFENHYNSAENDERISKFNQKATAKFKEYIDAVYGI